MNIFELAVSLTLNKEAYDAGLKAAESDAQSSGSKIGNALSTMGKTIATGLTAATTAVTALTTSAVNNYASYEQLTGGVEKLFGTSSEKVMEYAETAYQTAGLSANDYMETVTSFSASLISSLGGDTEAAAEMANTAITDMSDNANVFGTDMASIQNAYQGFAKQNYTMLDNLKLGYGGTKEEMERLIKDANALKEAQGEAADLTIDSYADVIEAIHLVQNEMQITGTTQNEAADTIEGSINTMKSAWTNFVTGLGDDNADVETLVNNLMDSVESVLNNVEPTVETILTNITASIPTIVSKGVDLLDGALDGMLPGLVKAATSLIDGLMDELPDLLVNLPTTIGNAVGEVIPDIVDAIINVATNLPSLIVSGITGIFNAAGSIITGLYTGIAKQFEDAVPEELADGTVGKVKTNFEESMDDGLRNLKQSLATLTQNQDWSEALKYLEIADQIEEKIIDSYNTAKTNMSQYSFENFQIATEAQVNNAMTLLGALEGMIDENGNVTGDIGVVQSYIDQINAILGDGAVTLEETPADWIIDIADKYKDEDGNITDPESLRADIEAELNTIFGTGDQDAIDLADTTYKAVSKVLSGYTKEQALADQDNIKEEIQQELISAGVPEVEAEAIAESTVTAHALGIWYGTSQSDSWSNSYLIKWLQDEGKLPATQAMSLDDYDLLLNCMMQYAEGSMTAEEFVEAVESMDSITDEEKDRLIDYVVDTSSVQQAITDLQELQKQTYLTSLTNAFSQGQIDQVTLFNAALDNSIASYENWNEVVDKANDGTFAAAMETEVESLNDATEARNAYNKLAEDYYDQLYDYLGGEEALNQSREDYIASMLEEDTMYQTLNTRMGEAETHLAEMTADHLGLVGGAEQAQEAFGGLLEKLQNGDISIQEFNTDIGYVKSAMSDLSDGVIDNTDQWEFWADSLGMSYDEFEAFVQALIDGTPTIEEAGKEGADAYAAGYTAESEANPPETETPESNAEENKQVGTEDAQAYEEGYEETETTNADKRKGRKPKSNSEENKQAGTEDANAYTEGVQEGLDSTTVDPSGVTAQLDDSTDAKQYGTDNISSFDEGIKGMKDTVAETVKTIRNLFNAYLGRNSTLPTDLEIYGGDAGDSFDSGLSGKTETIETTAESWATGVTTALANLPSDMTTTGTTSGSNLASGLNDMYWTIYNAITTIVNGINTAISGLPNDLNNAGSNGGQNLASGLSSKEGAVSSAASSLKKAGTDIDLSTSLNTTGQYGGQGLADGLNSKYNAVYSAACNLAAAAESGANITLKISSPSKKFKQIGTYAGQGLVNGLTSENKDVTKAATSLAEGMLDSESTFEAVAKYLSGTLSDVFDEEYVDDLYELGYDAGYGFYQGFTYPINLVETAAAKLATSLYAILGSDLRDSLTDGVSQAVESMTESFSNTNVVKQAKKLSVSVAEAFGEDFKTRIIGNIDDTFNQLSASIEEKYWSIYNSTTALLNAVTDAAKAKEDIDYTSEDLGNLFFQGLVDTSDDIVKSLETVAKGIEENVDINNIAQAMGDAGKGAGTAFGDGLLSTQKYVQEQASGLAKALEDSLNDTTWLDTQNKYAKSILEETGNQIATLQVSNAGETDRLKESVDELHFDLQKILLDTKDIGDDIGTLIRSTDTIQSSLGTMGVYLDGETLVGSTITDINKGLADLADKSARSGQTGGGSGSSSYVYSY